MHGSQILYGWEKMFGIQFVWQESLKKGNGVNLFIVEHLNSSIFTISTYFMKYLYKIIYNFLIGCLESLENES